MSDPTIAVVGASGFVGQSVLDAFGLAERRVTAVVRAVPEILASHPLHDVMLTTDVSDVFDVVINLAYPTAGHQVNHRRATAEIVDQAVRLVARHGRLIHVSTCAVFGPALERPVATGPVSRTRDTAYVEAKIDAELGLAAAHGHGEFQLDIVRLGNVLGPTSPGWASGLVGRILTGRPLLVKGAPGSSNGTDVRNVAAYLSFLALEADVHADVCYHHVAEFYDVPWTAWLQPMAEILGAELVYADPEEIRVPAGLGAELAEALRPLHPRAFYKALNNERELSSILRRCFGLLPSGVFTKLKGAQRILAARPREPDRSEQTLLSILAGRRQFVSSVAAGWAPPISLTESVDGTIAWLRES